MHVGAGERDIAQARRAIAPFIRFTTGDFVAAIVGERLGFSCLLYTSDAADE